LKKSVLLAACKQGKRGSEENLLLVTPFGGPEEERKEEREEWLRYLSFSSWGPEMGIAVM